MQYGRKNEIRGLFQASTQKNKETKEFSCHNTFQFKNKIKA